MEMVVTTGAIRRAKLQSNHHHLQTNTHCFTGWMIFLSSNQQCQNTEGYTGVDYMHPGSWNDLPAALRDLAVTLGTFRQMLKSFSD